LAQQEEEKKEKIREREQKEKFKKLRGPTILIIEEADIEFSDGSGEIDDDAAPWDEDDFDEDAEVEVEVTENTGPVKMRRRSLGSKPEPEKIKLPPLTVAAIPKYVIKDVRSKTVIGGPMFQNKENQQDNGDLLVKDISVSHNLVTKVQGLGAIAEEDADEGETSPAKKN